MVKALGAALSMVLYVDGLNFKRDKMLKLLFVILFSSSANPFSSLLKKADFWYISGIEKETGDVLNVFMIGKVDIKNYISDLAFSKIISETHQQDQSQLSAAIFLYKHRKHVGLIFKLVKRSRLRWSDHKTHFSIPVWVSTTTALPSDKSNESLKSDLRKINKNQLKYRITVSIDDVESFYYNMLVPYMLARHDGKILPADLSAIVKRVEMGECELLLVEFGEKAVAGVLIIREKGGRAVLWRNGLIDGDVDYWKIGAISATYYFSLEYLYGLGYDMVDFGYSRAFVNDGVLNYKWKWGMSVKSKYRKHLLLFPVNLTNSAFGFLRSNPFIYHNNGNSLAIACFSEQDTKQKIRLYEGVSEIVYFTKRKNTLARVQCQRAL